MKLFKAALLLVILVLVGCGKNLKPLTEEQKARLAATMQSGGNLIGSMSTAASKTKANNAAPNNADTLEGNLSTHVQTGQCTSKFVNTMAKSEFNLNQPFTFEMSLSGNGCPVEAYFLTRTQFTQGSGQSGELDFEMRGNFKLNDRNLAKYTDITAFDITTGKGHFSMNQNGGKGSAEMAATLTSTKEGTIGMYLNIEADFNSQGQGNSKMTFGVKYSDFTAEIVASGNGRETELTLNGEKISRSDLDRYFRGVQNVPRLNNLTL